MRIDFEGKLVEEREVRVGLVGCGGHAFRHLVPALQFVPARLAATCNRNPDKARAFAERFGADSYYSDHRQMLERSELDGVLICTGADENERISHAPIALDCLRAGCHAWMEKPAASSCAEVEALQEAERESGKFCMVGYKTMFFPANEKAVELAAEEGFGQLSVLLTQRPMRLPTQEQFEAYIRKGEPVRAARGFLDNFSHAASLVVFLAGMPETAYYERSEFAAGLITYHYASGAIASLALTSGCSGNAGFERSMLVGNRGKHIVVDNNIRVSYHQNPTRPEGWRYGTGASYFTGPTESTTATWEPEFSLAQLFNKGLFLQGFYGEINEFVRAILEERTPVKGHSTHAWQVTRMFEAFAEGPGKVVKL